MVGCLCNEFCIEFHDRVLNKKVNIKPISSYSSYQSLGTVQGISEKQDEQFKVLKKKSIALTWALVSSSVTTIYQGRPYWFT